MIFEFRKLKNRAGAYNVLSQKIKFMDTNFYIYEKV